MVNQKSDVKGIMPQQKVVFDQLGWYPKLDKTVDIYSVDSKTENKQAEFINSLVRHISYGGG